jgi:hypothetical protein
MGPLSRDAATPDDLGHLLCPAPLPVLTVATTVPVRFSRYYASGSSLSGVRADRMAWQSLHGSPFERRCDPRRSRPSAMSRSASGPHRSNYGSGPVLAVLRIWLELVGGSSRSHGMAEPPWVPFERRCDPRRSRPSAMSRSASGPHRSNYGSGPVLAELRIWLELVGGSSGSHGMAEPPWVPFRETLRPGTLRSPEGLPRGFSGHVAEVFCRGVFGAGVEPGAVR